MALLLGTMTSTQNHGSKAVFCISCNVFRAVKNPLKYSQEMFIESKSSIERHTIAKQLKTRYSDFAALQFSILYCKTAEDIIER